MNNTSQIDSQLLTRDAALNVLMYLPFDVPNGTPVTDILENAEAKLEEKVKKMVAEGLSEEEARQKNADDFRKLLVVQNAVKNDAGLGNLTITGQTSQMDDPATGRSYEKGGISACAFVNGNEKTPSDVIVVYRGTGAGEWYDNGIGLSGQTAATDQQSQATEYFDYIVRKYGWDKSSPDIYITGHSKGGNKTQFVVMTSAYSDLIVNGYSLDGQGLSQEAIDYLKLKYGEEEFERRRNKLYSISADNDYVNVLGVNNQDGRLIPDEHIFYLESKLDGVAWHYPDSYMNEDGTLTSFTEQGWASKFVQGVSEATMDLPAPIRSIVTNGMMGIFEMLMGNGTPVNGETISYAEIIASVPLLLEMLPAGIIEALGDQFGVNLDWLANVITATYLICFAPLNAAAYGVGKIIDLIIFVKGKIEEFGKKCKELTDKIVEFIEKGINKLRDWYNRNFNSGYQYASANPQIQLDTYKLRAYAQRLAAVNRRISSVDRRMDSLYWQVGLLDLWNLIQADWLTGYSWRLRRCEGYLNDTANDFDSVESNLINSL